MSNPHVGARWCQQQLLESINPPRTQELRATLLEWLQFCERRRAVRRYRSAARVDKGERRGLRS